MTDVVDGYDLGRTGPARAMEAEPVRESRGLRLIVTFLLAGVSAITATVAALSSDRSIEDERLGILASLPTVYWIAVGLAIVVTASVLWTRSSGGRYILLVLVPLWIVVLHLAPAFAASGLLPAGSVASLDRTTAMTDDGLIAEQIADPSGFHGMLSTITSGLPLSVLEWGSRLWPAVIAGVSALLVSALASRSYPRAGAVGPLAALVYVLIAWFEVGYLGSSAVGLVMVLGVLVLMESGPLQSDQGSASTIAALSRQAESPGDRPESYSVPVFVAVLLVGFGTVVNDPVLPAALCGVFLVLSLYGRTVALRLWVVLTAVYTVWSLLAEQPWWSRGLSEITGHPGRLNDALLANSSGALLGQRVAGWSSLFVLLFVALAGFLMTRSRFSALRPTVPLVPLAVVSSLAVVVTSPADEAAAHVVAVTAVFASILGGRLLAAARREAATLLIPVLIAISLPIFLLIRFGQMPESSDLTPTAVGGELAILMSETGSGG